MPVLYVVATPIGNLEDVTLRALRVLSQVGVIAAEDTRTTRKLLARHHLTGRLVSYHRFSGPGRVQALVDLLADQDVALVTDAGTPAVSDPGHGLVLAAIRAGVRVVPVPGPSAAVAALAASGLPTERVTFDGFPPRKAGERRAAVAALQHETRTVVWFEAPHRLRKTLADLADLLPDRPLAVCRELTKVHEEIFRGSPVTALEHFSAPRGEFTLVIGGAGLSAQTYWNPEPAGALATAGRYRRAKLPRPAAAEATA